jgi:urea transporter
MQTSTPAHAQRMEFPRIRFVLSLYAGCLFSGSVWSGACLLAATLLSPVSGLLGLVAVGSALFSARAFGLLSEKNPAAVYTYSALFVGLIAAHTFADTRVALALALFGAALSVLMTASMRELGQRFGLPALSLPFVFVYSAALGSGRALGLTWADLPEASHPYAAQLPGLLRQYLEALGAVVCDGRAEAGVLILAALLLSSLHTALLTTLGFAIGLAMSHLLQLADSLRLMLMLNAMFTALALGSSQYPRSARTYGLAALGAFLCSVLTPILAGPLGKLALTPLSLPFNLSFFVVLLVTRKRTQHEQSRSPSQSPAQPHSVIA